MQTKRIVGFLCLLLTTGMTGFSFVTSDGYPFMGQNNEMIHSQTYITSEFVYPFDDIYDFANRTIKLIKEEVILVKSPKYWPSSSIVIEEYKGIYQESHLHDENNKEIMVSNYLKRNPVVIKTIIIEEILNEEDLTLSFNLVKINNDSLQLSIKNYGNYDIKEVTITYELINQLNIYFDGYNHGYYEDWKRYNIREGDSIKTNSIVNGLISVDIENLKAGESKLYLITKNDYY